MAGDLAGTGVVVFDISPGVVRTAMTEEPGLAALLADVADEDWTPASRTGEVVAALTSGRFDALSGSFVHAEDDLEDLLVRMARRRARLAPAADDAGRRRRPAVRRLIGD